MSLNFGILVEEKHENDFIGDDEACLHCLMSHQLHEFSRKIYLNNVEKYHSFARAVIVLLHHQINIQVELYIIGQNTMNLT